VVAIHDHLKALERGRSRSAARPAGPPVRITTPHAPPLVADKLEEYVLPSADRITKTVRKGLG
jgi:hypothetical protein